MRERLLIVAACLLLALPALAEPTPPIQPRITETLLPPPVELPAPTSLPADVPGTPITAEEAVQIALRHQPGITIAQAGVYAAEGRLQSTQSALLPSLDLAASHNQVSGNTSGLSGTTTSSPGYRFSASVNQLLFDFNHSRSLVQQAQAQQRSANANLTSVQSDLALQVKQAFYIYVQNARLVQVDEANVHATQGHLDLAQARLRAGLAPPSDVVRAQTAVADAILGLTTARANASTSRVFLAEVMGIDPLAQIQTADTEEPAFPAEDVNLLIKQALAQRPEVLQAQASRDAAANALSASRVSNAPAFGASAGWLQRGDNLPLQAGSLSLGVAVQWPLVDSGFTAGLVKQAESGLQTADAQLRGVRLAVTSDVSQAFINLKTAEQRVVTADAGVANAAEGVRLTEGRYRSGLGMFLDVLDSQTALVTADTNRVNAVSAVNIARASLARAVGVPVPPAAK